MALAALPAVASAQTTYGAASPGFEPQYTNTPYLAWNGESIRLEKCVPNIAGLTTADLKADGVQANFQIESWTGTDPDTYTAPQFSPQTVKVFISNDFANNTDEGGVCAMGDVVANAPGLARIELDVDVNSPGASGKSGAGPVYAALAHEFLAAWMQLSTPTLSQMSSKAFGDSADAANDINDPNGTGDVNSGKTPAYLDVNVTGTFPLGGDPQIQQQFDQAAGNNATSVALPGDWVNLANALAVDYTPNNGTISGRNAAPDWDTSGESTDVAGYSVLNQAPDGPCAPESALSLSLPQFAGDSGAYVSPQYLDNGDNCTGGGPDGPFSKSMQGLSSNTTIGPFDPTDAADTDLPDGDLNSQDAPMPAALIDLNIAQNSGSSTDISGVGSFASADKTVTYSRDFQGDHSPGNLYAPFYDAYIPATGRPTDNSSGVDGAAGNNFTGFLSINADGSYSQYDPVGVFGPPTSALYHFWNAADLESNIGTATSCFDVGPHPETGDGTFRDTPSGPSEVDVYTDQNGEAQVQYVPGTGAYYQNLTDAKGNPIDMNLDGGCDVQEAANGILGTATITAKAEYPYKPSNFPSETSAPVTYRVHSQFNKELGYVPKGTSSDDQNARIVISHAQDVDGTPLSGETVCFTVNPVVGVTQFTGSVNGVSYGGATPVSDPNSLDRLCLRTDQNGNAAIEVLDSNPDTVDVIADYTNEGLLRDIPVDFSKPNSSGGNVPQGGQTPQPVPTTTVGTTSPSAAQVAAASPGLAKAVHHTVTRRARITVMRLLMPARGKHYMMLRVRSTHRTARVAMTLRVRSGHHTRVVHRKITVKTNRMVKLLVPRTVTRIKGVHLIR